MAREEVPTAARSEGPRWVGTVYYYLATAVDLGILLVGVISSLHGLVTAALPQLSSEARFSEFEVTKPDGTQPTEAERSERKAEALDRARLGGWDRVVRGAVTTVVGAPVFVWHLRQARRKT